LGTVSQEVLRALYRTSRLLVFPGREDFGISPVEAQACGLPVVAFGRGGAAETVSDRVTGVLFGEQTVESIAVALDEAWRMRFDPEDLRASALRFSAERFRREITDTIERVMHQSSPL
jgi:glycosyltransferase involved in cell wall biosynthesis